MERNGRILLIGYGNPGRLDDGLGPALAAEVERLRLPGIDVEADYQLTVEDAGDIARYDIVIFADASVNGAEPYFVEPVKAKPAMSFSTHSVEPEALMHMAHTLFDGNTRGYVLGIRGYEFNEFGERLSPRAARNLESAITYVRLVLKNPQLLDAPQDAA